MTLNAPIGSSAGGCGPRCRLRICLGIQLLSAQARTAVVVGDGQTPPAGPLRRLPSIRALAAATGVHRNTAAAVYRELESFGLVRCIRGSGTFALPRSVPPAPVPGPEPFCPIGDLAAVLAAELGRPVGEYRVGPARPLLLPLDTSPPPGLPVIPVVPFGRALGALRCLRPGSTVILLSESPRLGRLLRHTLCALHGDAVGLLRITEEQAGDAPVADLHLVDLLQLSRHGTDGRSEVLIPLRLIASAPRSAG